MQNALEHSAILLTCIKQESVLKTIFRFISSGRLRQILLNDSQYEELPHRNFTILTYTAVCVLFVSYIHHQRLVKLCRDTV